MAGTYREPNTREVWRISTKGSSLWADFEGGVFELRQVGRDEFEPVGYPRPMPVTFTAASNTTPRTLTTLRFGFPDQTRLEAVSVVDPSPEALASYAGEYWSEELQATYRLSLKQGGLWLTDLISLDGVRRTTVPSTQLRPVVEDEFDLTGAPIVFRFTRRVQGTVTEVLLNGFGERWIEFVRRRP